jgi:hypothetical protein
MRRCITLPCRTGVGFSSAGGLAVIRKSSSYAYQVLGPMTSSVAVLSRRRYPRPLSLTDSWPSGRLDTSVADDGLVRCAATADSIRHRFAEHPFQPYSFASWLGRPPPPIGNPRGPAFPPSGS